jgi:hypothetical protein
MTSMVKVSSHVPLSLTLSLSPRCCCSRHLPLSRSLSLPNGAPRKPPLHVALLSHRTPLITVLLSMPHAAAALKAAIRATAELEELDAHLETIIGNLVTQKVLLGDNDDTIMRIRGKTTKNEKRIALVKKDAKYLETLSKCCTVS